MRNLPNTQCDILHYEVTQETANGIEMCADGPAGMMDLDRVRFPGKYVPISDTSIEMGATYFGEFEITGPKGDALLPHEIAITHAEKIHLIAVDSTLNDYHHLHPTPIGNSGRWEYSFTPRVKGSYDLYLECVPLQTRKQLIVHDQLHVTAAASVSAPTTPVFEASDYQLEWNFTNPPVRAGSWVNFTITLSHPDASPIPLEVFMDAYSHVVGLREGTTGYAHIHPAELEQSPDPTHPSFAFTFYSGEKGNYRFWAQFQIEGKTIFFPYDVEVH